jgi:hypothetical protein
VFKFGVFEQLPMCGQSFHNRQVMEECRTIHSVAESGGLSDVFVLRSFEFLGESDEKPFIAANHRRFAERECGLVITSGANFGRFPRA